MKIEHSFTLPAPVDRVMAMVADADYVADKIRRTGALERDVRGARTLAASVPVNLRQFFPSDSARNFFATITVSHTYGAGGDSLGEVARRLQEDFGAQARPEALEGRLRRLIRVAPVEDVVAAVLLQLALRGGLGGGELRAGPGGRDRRHRRW